MRKQNCYFLLDIIGDIIEAAVEIILDLIN